MRARRSLTVLVTIGTLLAVPGEAAANGGAYLESDRTHYLPGETGTATTSVRIPERHRALLDDGPFYVFLIPDGAIVEEGKPIPPSVRSIGVLEVAHRRGAEFELMAELAIPDVASGYYSMAVCNVPCTVGGFGEVLSGSISVVATRREAELLTQNDRIRGRMFGFRRDARRAERRLEQVEAQLEAQLAFGSDERARLAGQIESLEERLASARGRLAAAESRPPFDPWLLGAILVLTAIAAVLAFRRKRSQDRLLSLDAFDVPTEPATNGDHAARRPMVRSGIDDHD